MCVKGTHFSTYVWMALRVSIRYSPQLHIMTKNLWLTTKLIYICNYHWDL